MLLNAMAQHFVMALAHSPLMESFLSLAVFSMMRAIGGGTPFSTETFVFLA
jgi:hypothetical protein